MLPKIIVILGPTGAGKSALGVYLAKKFNGEIVSADSRQVYKKLDIGTAKVTKNEMDGIAHYLLDVVEPSRTYTASEYKVVAQKAIKEICSQGHLPFLVGGSGFYIDAVIYDMNFPPVMPNKELRKILEEKDAEELYSQLQQADPDRASSIDPYNKKRLVRALEIIEAIGKVPPIKLNSPYHTLKIGTEVLDWEKHDKWLLERLNQRLESGLVDEVRNLHKNNLAWERLHELGLEYRWVALFLQNKVEYKDMVEKLWVDIRQYARRQMTWFKRDKEIHWVSSPTEAEMLVKEYMIYI